MFAQTLEGNRVLARYPDLQKFAIIEAGSHPKTRLTSVGDKAANTRRV